MEIKLRKGALAPQPGDTLYYELDGWDFRQLPKSPSAFTQVHTNTIIKIAMGPTRSPDFVSGVSGWEIRADGSAEFNDIVARGTIYADAGLIGGWTINAAYLAKDTGADATSAGLAPTDYPFYAGATYANRGSAPFRVTPAGALVATSATISGSITATSGTIGGWTINATQIKADGDAVILDKTGVITVGGAGYLTSSPFVSGVQGWRITPTHAEFGNVTVRGELHSAVWVKDLIGAHAGTMVIAKSAGVLAAEATATVAGVVIYCEPSPGGGWLFDVGDYLRLMAETGDGVRGVWVDAVSREEVGDLQKYTCAFQSGTVPTTFPEGTAVIDYGASGQGYLLMTADLANSPYYDVRTHAGVPWTTETTRVRLGNLAGITDADLNPSGYGLYCDNVFLKGKMVWSKGSLDADGITLDIDEAADEAWIKFGSANDHIRGISGGGIAIHSLADWIDVRAWKSGSDARCTLGPAASGGVAVLSYNNTAAGSPDTSGVAKLLYQDYVTEVAVVAAGYRQVRMFAQNGSGVYEWFELQPTTSEAFIKLGDAAGIHKFKIKDSVGTTQFHVNSDGVVGIYYAGTQVGEISALDTTWFRFNQGVAKNIYTPRYIRADGGLAAGNTMPAAGELRTTSHVYVGGSIITSTPLGCRAISTQSQTIPHNTATALSFNTQIHDTDGGFAPTSTALYAKHAGYYMAGSGVGFNGVAAARLMVCSVRLNGATYVGSSELLVDENAAMTLNVSSGMFYMAVNHYIEIVVYQNSGGNMTTIAASTTNQQWANAWLVRVA